MGKNPRVREEEREGEEREGEVRGWKGRKKHYKVINRLPPTDSAIAGKDKNQRKYRIKGMKT